MDLSKKLQIPAGTPILLVNVPNGLKLDLVGGKEEGSAVLLFAHDSEAVRKRGRPLIEAAKDDRLAWVAYPKAGQLKTDLNRDRLAELMKPFGIEPVRLVSIDDVWSAMRFRPRKRS